MKQPGDGIQYIFMDNYRGFSKALVPLASANFLVGENSTGKSSFLSLLSLLFSPTFWFSPSFSSITECNLGSFKDIVSVASKHKSKFTVGTFASYCDKDNSEKIRHEYAFMTFKNLDGVPALWRYTESTGPFTVRAILERDKIRYNFPAPLPVGKSDESVEDVVERLFEEHETERKWNDHLDIEGPAPFPLRFLLTSLLPTHAEGKSPKVRRRGYTLPPIVTNLAWLAPIRTKPRRTYDGFSRDFSPEGEHTPYLIRKEVSTKEKSKQFAERLSDFGESSGLFKHVNAHSFGRDASAPFEVTVELTGPPLNINNVGYGVSQVLPVIVEMLTRPRRHWFAIQQPEVHLHPRAQAALGDLLYYLMTEYDHHYLIETHSDFLIDRFRYNVAKNAGPETAQVLFFERVNSGNSVKALRIDAKGHYPKEQPASFRDFFIREEMRLLEM